MSRPLVWLGVASLLAIAAIVAVLPSLSRSDRELAAALPGERGAADPAASGGEPSATAPAAHALARAAEPATNPRAAREVVGPAAHDWTALVVDARDGAPIPDTELTLARGEHSTSASSDANGRASLRFPLGPGATLAVRHAAYVDLLLAEVDLAREGHFALEPSGSIRGLVLGPGAASPDALTIGLWDDRGDRYEGIPLRETPPDSAHGFRFDDVSPGAYALGAFGGECALAFRDGIVVSAGRETYASLEVDSGLALRGRVLFGARRLPLAGARIEVLPEVQGLNDSVERLGARIAVSRADGRFEVTGLGQGGHDVTVRAPWAATRSRREDLSRQSRFTEREFVFAEPTRVTGVVSSPDGAPAVAALVALSVRRSSDRLDPSRALAALDGDESGSLLAARTDASGRFAFERAPGGDSLHLVAWPAEFDPERPSGHLPGGARVPDVPPGSAVDDADIVLLEGPPLRGRVVDQEGLGLPGAEVRLDVALSGPPRRVHSVEAGADGTFALPAVPWNASRLRVQLAGYRGESPDLSGRDPGAEIVVTLHPDAAVRGRVLDELDRAVPRAAVRLSRGRRQSRSARSDEFGRFAVSGLQPGTWRVGVDAPGFELGPDGPGTVNVPRVEQLVLRLRAVDPRPPVGVSGEVVDAGTGEPVPNLRLRGLPGGVVHVDGTRFHVEGMPPGKTRLRARSEGYQDAVWPEREYLPGENVQLPLREVWTVGVLVVRVRDQADRPLRRANVRLHSLPRREGGSGVGAPALSLSEQDERAGRYVTGSAPRRVFELVVARKGFRTHRETITVAGARTDLTVRLERSAPGGGD